MSKVISFSLWGDIPTYTIGAINNAELAAKLFPDWTCIFYCFDTVPSNIITELQSRSNSVVRVVDEKYDVLDCRGMFPRFLPADEEGVEYMISRDTDSRLSQREKLAIEEWIQGGKDVHIMRDHPYHGTQILGGMWGIRGGKLNGLQTEIDKFKPTRNKGQDQLFLREYVWGKISNGELTTCVHDPFFNKIPFPEGSSRGKDNGGVWFVGQVFDENDIYNNQNDVDILVNTEM